MSTRPRQADEASRTRQEAEQKLADIRRAITAQEREREGQLGQKQEIERQADVAKRGHESPSPRAATTEIAASMLEGMWACRSPSDIMQILTNAKSNDKAALYNTIGIYMKTGRCIDLNEAQLVYVASEPLGSFLCVRPADQKVCYWTPSAFVRLPQ